MRPLKGGRAAVERYHGSATLALSLPPAWRHPGHAAAQAARRHLGGSPMTLSLR